MDRNSHPSCILATIFALAAKERGDYFFRAHPHELHSIFYKLKDSHPILDCFVFSESREEPFSRVLHKSIQVLQFDGILNWLDFQGSRLFRVRETAKDYFWTRSQFTLNELEELRKAAKDLTKKLKETSR